MESIKPLRSAFSVLHGKPGSHRLPGPFKFLTFNGFPSPVAHLLVSTKSSSWTKVVVFKSVSYFLQHSKLSALNYLSATSTELGMKAVYWSFVYQNTYEAKGSGSSLRLLLSLATKHSRAVLELTHSLETLNNHLHPPRHPQEDQAVNNRLAETFQELLKL